MTRFFLIILYFSFLITSCNNNKPKQPLAIASKQTSFKSIHILPLGNISKQVIEDVSSGLVSFYHKEIIIDKAVPLNYALLAKSKERYSADSILKKFSNNNVTLVLTEKDIVTKKDDIDEYGVFGLGSSYFKTTLYPFLDLKETHHHNY